MVFLLIGAPAALAHGTFVDARPLPGVEVGGVVDEVSFLFPEPVETDSAVIAVIGPQGHPVPASGQVESPIPSVVRVGIEALTLPGEYRVDHAVTAHDGFVFEGSFTFSFDPSAPPLDPLPYGRDGLGWPWLAGIAGAIALAGWMVRTRSRHGDEV